MYNTEEANSYQHYFKGGGEMGKRTREYDWANSALGPCENWPPGLLNTLSMVLKSKFPMFIWWGPDLIQFYNDAYRPSLGQEGKHPAALGQRGEDCWQEIWPVIKPLIDQVMAGGDSTWNEDQLIPIYRNNRLEDVYWTFSYTPILGNNGEPGGVLVICHETTEKVKAYSALEQATEALEQTKREAIRQRDRLKNFFMQAPAGICILDGPELIFELVNPAYQQLFTDRQLLGKPLFEALPEVKDQVIADILNNVYTNDKIFEGNSLLVPLARYSGGPIEDRYFNFIYQPRHNLLGEVDGIFVFVFEVTEIANARNELKAEKDKLSLAIGAAELGTFDLDLVKGTMEWDNRCRTLFGISHANEVNYEKDFVGGLHPEDRKRITETINAILDKSISDGNYDVEYRTVGAEDQKLRWVRAKGKVYFNDDRAVRFTGSVLDITEQKTDELRKNDFIGMVSHELKTPLTSLKAYVQVLQSNSANPEFQTELLSRMDRQVTKMSSLINGFLNVSRLESGKIQLDKQELDLSHLLTTVAEETQLVIKSHKILLNPSESILVKADQEKIASVVNNLLSNAAKYSPADSTIELSCKVIDGTAHVSVKDEGFGIEPHDVENLFKRYYRVRTGKNKHVSGFGIGLYLCSEILSRHDGKIWVNSEAGKGSTFTFSLPTI